jgi:hypothetical protein
MESIGRKVIKVYTNPIEEKKKQDAAQYLLEHPEDRVENKKYALKLSDENFLVEKLKDVCTKRIHTWSYRVDCDLDIVGEENEGEGTLIYGFFKYKPVIVPFICVYDYSLEKAFVYTFKKVEDTNDYDFDGLVDDFLVEHSEFQHIYQSDRPQFILKD